MGVGAGNDEKHKGDVLYPQCFRNLFDKVLLDFWVMTFIQSVNYNKPARAGITEVPRSYEGTKRLNEQQLNLS